MDNQINPQEPINQALPKEEIIPQEPVAQELVPQETPILETQNPEPQLPPQPETKPEPELLSNKPTVPSEEYQKIINEYAANTQTQPEAEPQVQSEPRIDIQSPQSIIENQPKSPQEQLQDLGITTPPSTNNLLKMLFMISLVIFILVFAILAFVYFKSKSNSSIIDDQSSTISSTPTPVSSETCSLNDKTYKIGESFPSADGCNTCSCASDLNIVCTEKACAPTPTSVATKSATKNATTSANKISDFSVSKRTPQGLDLGDENTTKSIDGPLKTISITFNNQADSKTITNETFYVLDGIDSKVAGKISYSTTTKTATITFTDPVISSDINTLRLTVVIKGIKDINGNFIKDLTYNIDIKK